MSVRQHKDLSGVRDQLVTRRAALEQRHSRIEHDLQRRNEPLVADSSDRAIQLQNDEALQAIEDATQAELVVIDEALQRLELGLYGVCKVCGGDIEAARLKAFHAVTCAVCAEREFAFGVGPVNRCQETWRKRLAHGSLLLIPATTNEAFKHRLPRAERLKSPRVSVTLRRFPRSG